jgi:hypothetical protein
MNHEATKDTKEDEVGFEEMTSSLPFPLRALRGFVVGPSAGDEQ